MKILVACEFSGIVREEFKKLGHEAWSCDLLDTLIPGNHIKDDVLKYLDKGWDMLIAFPPCTNLACSGARYFKQKELDGRQQESIDFFMKFINAPINKIAVENPIGIMSSKYRKPDQIIQPYNFGEDASKQTCLWLKNLPILKGTKYTDFPVAIIAVKNNQVTVSPFIIRAVSSSEAIGKSYKIAYKLYPDSKITVIVNELENSHVDEINNAKLTDLNTKQD